MISSKTPMVVGRVQNIQEQTERIMRYVVTQVPDFASVDPRNLDFNELTALLNRERDYVPLQFHTILDAAQDVLNDALISQYTEHTQILSIHLIVLWVPMR